MGLGLIALGFIFLEGLQVSINSFTLIPEYVSFMIILIGLLCIRKRKIIKSLNIASVFTFVLFCLLFIPIFTMFDFFILLMFYIILFYGIYQLTGNIYTKKYYILFIIIRISLYGFFDIQEHTDYLLILLAIKVILTYIIAYHWYKDNKILDEVYEINNVEHQYNISTKTLLFTLVASLVAIILIQEPLMNKIEKDKVIQKSWYGEIEGKVIVERIWVRQSRGLIQEVEWSRPCIWINQSDFNQSQYYSLSFLDNEISYKEIVKEDNSDDYFIGKREGYCYLSYGDLDLDWESLISKKDWVMEIRLFDEDKQLVNCYEVNLSTKTPYIEYGYKDNEVQIDHLQIYDGFIMNTGQVTVDKQYEHYRLCISGNEELKNDTFYWLDISVSNSQIMRNHIIYKEKYTHIYIGESPNYYIHIIDENNQCVKTIQVEKQ